MLGIGIGMGGAAGGGGYSNEIAYTRPPIHRHTTSYATYDPEWQLDNGTYDYTPPEGARPTQLAWDSANGNTAWNNLAHNNAFGTTSRFTDLTGGSDFVGDDYFIDHYTGLGYCYTTITDTWANAFTTANSATNAGFSDWRVANIHEVYSVFGHRRFVEAHFDNPGADNIFSSSTRFDLTTYMLGAAYTTGGTQLLKTTTEKFIMVRNHYT